MFFPFDVLSLCHQVLPEIVIHDIPPVLIDSIDDLLVRHVDDDTFTLLVAFSRIFSTP